ncbi:MAG: DMT family transporter [Flavobacteriales bacterium]|nr:DMT family transporter [Flavobacteriales bacterium]
MKNIKGIIYALISSATFGLIPFFSIPVINEGHIAVPSLLFYRFLFALLAIGLIGFILRKNFVIPIKTFFTIIILGVFYAATSMGLTMSYQYIPSGIATTIHFLYPILVTLIMVLFFREKASGTLFVAALISLFGISMMNSSEGQTHITGILLVILTIVTYATYIVGVNKTGVEKIDPIILTFYVFLASTIMFGMYALFSTEGLQYIKSTPTLLNITLLALLPTLISDFTLVLAIKKVGGTVTAILGSMEPLVAVAVGVLYFNESLTASSVIGFILIIASVSMVILRQAKKR